MNKVLPILFNTEMVCAILDGRKTVTRRVCKDGNDYTVPDMNFYNADKRTYAVHNYADREHTEKLSIAERTCPVCPGDILYVRETWTVFRTYPHTFGFVVMHIADKYIHPCIFKDMNRYLDKFQKYENKEVWNTPYSMPKEAARIFLKVTDIRIERLQDITEQQAVKEGFVDDIEHCVGDTAVGHFIKCWETTIKKQDMERYGWKANPWVWTIEFERCEKPESIDK